MRRIAKLKDRDALRAWQMFHKDFARSAEIDPFESEADISKRKELLLQDFEAFCKFYFPGVAKAEFAAWHRKFHRYLIKNEKATVTAKVARDMAKSSITAMLIIFLYFKGEIRSLGYFSHIQTQATNLLNAVKTAFEKNQRLIHDFGSQVGLNTWTAERFVTITGASFRAVGAGQNPRGEKNEDSERFDFVVFDDFDDPEVCRNPERLDNHWQYVLGDVIPAFHVSGRRRLVFINNKIAEDCIVQRAEDHFKTISQKLAVKPLSITVNLVDHEGRSNWPEAYTDQECSEMIALAGHEADTEYFNNPSSKGITFQKDWIQYKKLNAWSKYKYLIAYHDYGFNRGDRKRTGDTKALILVGFHQHEFHILKVYVDHTSMPGAVAWHYDLDKILKAKNATAVMYMEDVFLADIMWDEFDRAAKDHGYPLPIKGDKRKKPDKDLRIQAIAAHFEKGRVYIDERIQHDHHTANLVDQLLKFRPGTKTKKDGPDALEGAMFLLREMTATADGINYHKPRSNKYAI